MNALVQARRQVKLPQVAFILLLMISLLIRIVRVPFQEEEDRDVALRVDIVLEKLPVINAFIIKIK